MFSSAFPRVLCARPISSHWLHNLPLWLRLRRAVIPCGPFLKPLSVVRCAVSGEARCAKGVVADRLRRQRLPPYNARKRFLAGDGVDGGVGAGGVLPSRSQTASDGVDADQQIREQTIGGCLIIFGQQASPFFQQRNLLHMQGKQRVGPDFVRDGETWSPCAGISTKHFVEHSMREIEFCQDTFEDGLIGVGAKRCVHFHDTAFRTADVRFSVCQNEAKERRRRLQSQ